MSNHVATITKDEGRCSFSRKALSVFMAVLLAFLMMPMVPAESALADNVTNSATVKSVSVDVNGWTQAVSAQQTVEATITLSKAVSEGDIMMVDLVKAGTDTKIADQKTATFQAGSLDTATVEFTVAAAKAAVAGTYAVKIGDAEYATFVVYPAAQDQTTAFANGKATAGVDQDGLAVEPDSKGVFSVAGGKDYKYVVPTKVLPAGASNAIDVVLAADLAEYASDETPTAAIYKDNSGQPGDVATYGDLKQPGTFWVKVNPAADSGYPTGAELAVKFVIAASSLDGATAYVVNDDDAFDTSKTDIVYDGADYAGRIGFAIDGTPVTANVAWYKSDGSEADDVTNAGAYTALLTGTGAYAGSTANVTVTVAQLDLSSAELFVDDVEYTGTTLTVDNIKTAGAPTVNGKAINEIAGVNFAAGPVAKVGAYAATFSAASNGQKNVVNSGTAAFNAVSDKLDDDCYKYGNATVTDAVEGKVFGTGRNAFDLADVWVDHADIDESDYTVTLTNADGVEVESADAAGAYTLTIEVIPGSDFALGGKKEAKFTVSTGSLATAEVTFTYKGDVYSGAPIAYTGSDVLADVAVAVKLGNKTLVEGTDYELVVTDASGAKVTEAVDAGAYTMAVKGLAYTGTISQALVVGKAQITNLRVQTGEAKVLPWTGEAVTPVVEYTTDGVWTQTDSTQGASVSEYVAPEDAEWSVLPADQFIATYYDKDFNKIDASEVVDEGAYFVEVALNTKAVNLAIAAAGDDSVTNNPVATILYFAIDKTVMFIDVPSDAWYAESVYKAQVNGFMEGVASGIFAPERTMTRAEFAQTVYNMAHEAGEQGPNNAWETYPTQFSDVASNAWYAKAVEWAARYGIVTGKSATEFDPNGTVTREEIATMLYRYLGNGAKADASVLDRFEDKAEVCDWAVDAMAWAVEEGVVNGVSETSLAPHGDAQRCMVAAMAVRAQPENIDNM